MNYTKSITITPLIAERCGLDKMVTKFYAVMDGKAREINRFQPIIRKAVMEPLEPIAIWNKDCVPVSVGHKTIEYEFNGHVEYAEEQTLPHSEGHGFGPTILTKTYYYNEIKEEIK